MNRTQCCLKTSPRLTPNQCIGRGFGVKYHPLGRIAQSVARLTQEPEVQGLIPGPATYFRFSFRRFKKGKKLSVTGEGMCTKYWLTAKAV